MVHALRRALVACVAVGMLAGLGTVSASAASGTTGPASAQTATISLQAPASTGVQPNARTQGQLSFCIISMSAGAVERGFLVVSVGAVCQHPSFVVSGGILFLNGSRVAGFDPTNGHSNFKGQYFHGTAKKFGTIGHRSVSWCVDIATSNGGVGSGCLLIRNV